MKQKIYVVIGIILMIVIIQGVTVYQHVYYGVYTVARTLGTESHSYGRIRVIIEYKDPNTGFYYTKPVLPSFSYIDGLKYQDAYYLINVYKGDIVFFENYELKNIPLGTNLSSYSDSITLSEFLLFY